MKALGFDFDMAEVPPVEAAREVVSVAGQEREEHV